MTATRLARSGSAVMTLPKQGHHAPSNPPSTGRRKGPATAGRHRCGAQHVGRGETGSRSDVALSPDGSGADECRCSSPSTGRGLLRPGASVVEVAEPRVTNRVADPFGGARGGLQGESLDLQECGHGVMPDPRPGRDSSTARARVDFTVHCDGDSGSRSRGHLRPAPATRTPSAAPAGLVRQEPHRPAR